jgi:hypothetical protein
MKSLRALCALTLVCVGCAPTGPGTTATGAWGYQASDLTDGVVLCSIAVPMNLTQADTVLAGTYFGSYMSCSTPIGATSTIAQGTVSGTVSPSTLTFTFQNTQEENYGSVSGSVVGNTNTGTHLAGQGTFDGATTMQVSIAGIPHTLTGTFFIKTQ